VAEKIGAVKEGVLKDRLKWNDIFFAAILFSLVDFFRNSLF
jgi:hypothetical protein